MSIIAILSLFHRFLLLPPALKVSVVCTLSQLTAAFSSPYLEVITLSGGAPPPHSSLLLLCGVLSVNKGTWEFLPHINEPQALKGPLFFLFFFFFNFPAKAELNNISKVT